MSRLFQSKHQRIFQYILVFICMMILFSFYLIHVQDSIYVNPALEHPFVYANIELPLLQTQDNIHPPPLPSSKRYVIPQNTDNNKQFHQMFWEQWSPLMPVPSLSKDNKMYVMNVIYNAKAQEIDIFLLNKNYFASKRGLHSWVNGKHAVLPDGYRHIHETLLHHDDYADITPSLACVFVNSESLDSIIYYVSSVQYVPNNTTRDRYVNTATEILRCKTPSDSIPFSTFLLTQRHQDIVQLIEHASNYEHIETDRIHIQLSFDPSTKMAVNLLTKDVLTQAMNQPYERYLSLCIPPISEPIPFIIENIAHHLMLGIEHIYIGTHFEFDKKDRYLQLLMDRVSPWFDKGLVSIWPHEQPHLSFTDKAKHHWLNQCLYYAKGRDRYVLSLDADEFLLLHPLERRRFSRHETYGLLANMLRNATQNGEREWCWLTFASYNVWKLTNANASYMIERFNGRESNYQYTWSKVIWDTEHLWYTGYHAGGSCSALNHSWYETVDDWRDEIDDKHVYRWNATHEGRVWHFYNSRYIRIEPEDTDKRRPWFKTMYDNTMIEHYLWYIRGSIEKELRVKASYPDDEFDVMKSAYYIKHYGEGHPQTRFH